jgi:hypothetical protein
MRACWVLQNRRYAMFFPLNTNREAMREARKNDPDMKFSRIEGIIQTEPEMINGKTKYERK